VSTAAPVPETWELTGDDARKTLLATGRGRLAKDAFVRLRAADGFSHARSLAFVTSLVFVQGLIALVGLASALGGLRIGGVVIDALEGALPGPSSGVLTDAVNQAKKAGGNHQYLPLLLGLAGTLVTATTAMGQIERGLNRIYGIEQDRPTKVKYGRAFLLAISVGAALACAFVLLAFGKGATDPEGTLRDVWAVTRWPLALVLVTGALTALLRWGPKRRQPAWSWLAFGAGIGVLGWTFVTLLLGLGFALSSTFGDTYGPLAGLVALQLWTLLSAVAILYGAAVAAQLEAVRAGAPSPRQQREAAVPRSDSIVDRQPAPTI
jgi:YihY family inner membrane protein